MTTYSRFLVAVSAIVLFCVSCTGSSRTPQEQGNVNPVRTLMLEIEQGNFDFLDEAMASDFKMHFPNSPNITFDQQKNAIKSFYASFPDHYHTFEDVLAEGDKVAVRFTFGGTHQNEFRGIDATGKKIEWAAFFLFRFENGKIAEIWGQEDYLSLLSQLGMRLTTEPQSG